MSHLSALGFPTRSRVKLGKLFDQILQKRGIIYEVPKAKGGYFYFKDSSGAELWFQFRNGEYYDLSPHFDGSALRKVKIVAKTSDKKNPLNGTFSCWAIPTSKRDIEYPFDFSVPYFLYSKAQKGQIYTIQLVAFTEKISFFKDEKDFHKRAQKMGELGLATFSFIPGNVLFSDSRANRPQPYCMLSGKIRSWKQWTNMQTGYKFTSLNVRTLCGMVNIVVDQKLVKKKPMVGGVVSGTFWLSARIKE